MKADRREQSLCDCTSLEDVSVRGELYIDPDKQNLEQEEKLHASGCLC